MTFPRVIHAENGLPLYPQLKNILEYFHIGTLQPGNRVSSKDKRRQDLGRITIRPTQERSFCCSLNSAFATFFTLQSNALHFFNCNENMHSVSTKRCGMLEQNRIGLDKNSTTLPPVVRTDFKTTKRTRVKTANGESILLEKTLTSFIFVQTAE